MKVFISRVIPDIAEEILVKHGFDVKIFKKDRPITKEEFIRGAKDADAIMPLVSDTVDKELIDHLKKCKIIANVAVGYNNIDIEYAKSKGMVVTNTPDVLTDATADLAVTLILSCARRVVEGDNIVRDGKFLGWKPKMLLGMELRDKKVGIIGAGRIGFETAKRLKSFGTKIQYFDRSRKSNFDNELEAKRVSLNNLLKTSDIISIHVPLTDQTRFMLNSENLPLVKKGSIIVNTARGDILHEETLIKLLKSGHLFSAGFDVYENEPRVNPKFLKLKNVVLLPHIGSATVEARNKMAELAAKNVVNVLRNKKPLTPVK